MDLNKDVVVANCLKLTDDWEFWGYDRNKCVHAWLSS